MRYEKLDEIRGITIISMVLYHACWDLVYIFGVNIHGYSGLLGYIWQQSICITFIILSGFCFSLGHKAELRGLTVFFAGALVTAVTCIFMPQDRIIFGVLTLIGTSMLITSVLRKLLDKIPPAAGLPISLLLFIILKGINHGYLNFIFLRVNAPVELYHGFVATFLGFMDKDFFSTDYFSLLPWYLLFVMGFYLYKLIYRLCGLDFLKAGHISVLSFLGKHSLIIYLLHQPVIYLALNILM